MTVHKMKKSNKGFTLVELIVVLVILAVLAAILSPALIGYIDQARAKKYLANANTVLQAAQAQFSAQYALRDEAEYNARKPVVSGACEQSTSGNEDQDITNTEFAKEILRLAGLTGDYEPYLLMVAVGSNVDDDGTTRNISGGRKYTVSMTDKYTIYYVVYIENENAKPWYYYNGEWTTTNPRVDDTNYMADKNNVILHGINEGVRLQYYLISNHNPKYIHTDKQNSVKSGAFWGWLKSMK